MESRDRALLRVGIAAALADGTYHERERPHLEALAQAAGLETRAALAEGGALPPDLATQLGGDEACKAAYDLAVAVCNADGVATPAETRFLDGLRGALGLNPATVAGELATAEDLARAPMAGGALGGAASASLDDVVLQHAVLAGALELLPQALANLAVIPVQLRMVYLIGQRHGQQPDATQAKDLLGTLGIGAATQVLDGVARRVLGGVARGVLGRLLGGLAGSAAGAGTVFAATYALGHAADQYYAQGRRLSPADLRALFTRLRDQAQELYPKIKGQIEERAKTLDLQQLLAQLGRR